MVTLKLKKKWGNLVIQYEHTQIVGLFFISLNCWECIMINESNEFIAKVFLSHVLDVWNFRYHELVLCIYWVSHSITNQLER